MILKKLGERIKQLRKKANISQEKLAEMAEISPRQMVRIEAGQSFPTIDNLEKIINLNLSHQPRILENTFTLE